VSEKFSSMANKITLLGVWPAAATLKQYSEPASIIQGKWGFRADLDETEKALSR
jgi:hypothetical protein